MGECWNCGKEVVLREEETRCDSCGQIVRYWCNNCKEPFDVENKEGIKEKECKWCGFFKCPSCKSCSLKCGSLKHFIKIEKILKDKELEEDGKIRDIIDYFEDIKLSKKRRNCVYGVPISYAQNRIKSYLVRMRGFKTKDDIDTQKFEERRNKIGEAQLNQEFTIKNIKEAGSYGQEWRDVFNLSVCLGELKYEKKKFTNKDGLEIEYDSWTKIKGEVCKNLSDEDLIVKSCTKCKKIYEREEIHCFNCVYSKDTKNHNRGDAYILKEKISNNPICQLKRGEFEDG
jgi:hypothetical protein